MRRQRGHLERHPAVHAVGSGVDRPEQAGGPTQVGQGQLEERPFGFMLPPSPAAEPGRIPRPASRTATGRTGIGMPLAERGMRVEAGPGNIPVVKPGNAVPGPRRVSLAIRRGHRAAEITAAARTITQRAPVTLTLVRQRAQPTAETIVRLAVTAVFAYLVALLIPGTSRPVLAPLTALLVVQVSIYQRLRSAVRRVASVVAGVLLALGLSAWVGFNWWSLGVAIAVGLAVGYTLRLGDHVLEVPISAMLIPRPSSACLGRGPAWRRSGQPAPLKAARPG